MIASKRIAELAVVMMVVAWPLTVDVQAGETEQAGLEKALEAVEAASQHHIGALQTLLKEAPEEAKPAIRHAIHVSQYGKTGALEALELARSKRPQERASLYWKHAKRRVAHMREHGAAGKPEFVETLAKDYRDCMGNMFDEIAKARAQGADMSKALEVVSAATEKHEEVLGGVLGKVPDEAKPAIKHAIEVSGRGRETALGTLRRVQKARERGGSAKRGGPPAGRKPGPPVRVGPPAGVGRPEKEEERRQGRRGGGGTRGRGRRP